MQKHANLLARIVSNLLLAGPPEACDPVVDAFVDRFSFGIVIRESGRISYFESNILQHEDSSTIVGGEDTLSALECMSLSRSRRRESDPALMDIETQSLDSINCSIGWPANTDFLLCSGFASTMQRKAPTPTVHAYVNQLCCLKLPKRLETFLHYPTIIFVDSFKSSVLEPSDAWTHNERGQLAYIAGLLIYELSIESVFHL